MNLPETEKKELLRLLFVAIIQEADRMNLQGIENAVFIIKKMIQPENIKTVEQKDNAKK